MCGDDEKDVIEIESVKNFLDAEQVGGCQPIWASAQDVFKERNKVYFTF